MKIRTIIYGFTLVLLATSLILPSSLHAQGAQGQLSAGAKIKQQWQQAKDWCNETFQTESLRKICLGGELNNILSKHTGKTKKGKKWRLTLLGDNNPRYEDILDSIAESLATMTDANMTMLLETPINYDIVNYPYINPDNGVLTDAFTSVITSTGVHNITYYAPSSHLASKMRQKNVPRGLAQPADQLAQFDSRTFTFLTTWHELSHVIYYIARHIDTSIALSWNLEWSQSLIVGGTPGQLYLHPTQGALSAYAADHEEGFAVASSYVWMEQTFQNSSIKHAIQKITNLLVTP